MAKTWNKPDSKNIAKAMQLVYIYFKGKESELPAPERERVRKPTIAINRVKFRVQT